jgi:hypothetical protein
VKPYVKSNKNDARDAEAICEAMSRPEHALRDGEDGRAKKWPPKIGQCYKVESGLITRIPKHGQTT